MRKSKITALALCCGMVGCERNRTPIPATIVCATAPEGKAKNRGLTIFEIGDGQRFRTNRYWGEVGDTVLLRPTMVHTRYWPSSPVETAKTQLLYPGQKDYTRKAVQEMWDDMNDAGVTAEDSKLCIETAMFVCQLEGKVLCSFNMSQGCWYSCCEED